MESSELAGVNACCCVPARCRTCDASLVVLCSLYDGSKTALTDDHCFRLFIGNKSVLLIFDDFNQLHSSIYTFDTILSNKETMGLQRSRKFSTNIANVIFSDFNQLQSSIYTSDTMLSDRKIMGLQRSRTTK